MNRLLLQLLGSVFLLAVAPTVFNSLQPMAASVPADQQLPFESLLASLLPYMPWLASLGGVVFLFSLMFGEAAFGRHEPLPKMSGARDLYALQPLLRSIRAWLAQQKLPSVADPVTESIATLCGEIGLQLARRDSAAITATVTSLNKLLSVELSTLVVRYQRVPRAQKLLRSFGGSANELLLSGLRAIDDQLGVVYETLANGDLRDLAVQARYLELASENECRSAVTTRVRPLPLPLKRPDILEPVRSDTKWGERSHEPGIPLMRLDLAVMAGVAIESSLEDSEREPNAGHISGGGGGAFGGAGASGDWSDAESENGPAGVPGNWEDSGTVE